jgi:hypothetical protein
MFKAIRILRHGVSFPAVATSSRTHLDEDYGLHGPLQTYTIVQRSEQWWCLAAKGAEIRGVPHVLMLLAAYALLTSSTVVEAQNSPAERPIYTLGERWIRSDGVYDLIRIKNGQYVLAADVDRQLHVTQDLVVAKVQKGQWVMEFDPAPKLTWPLEVGKWGTSSGLWRTPSHPGGGSVRFTWHVQAYEDVQVVAGTFKALRISVAIEALVGAPGAHCAPDRGNSSPGMRPRCGSLSRPRASAWT